MWPSTCSRPMQQLSWPANGCKNPGRHERPGSGDASVETRRLPHISRNHRLLPESRNGPTEQPKVEPIIEDIETPPTTIRKTSKQPLKLRASSKSRRKPQTQDTYSRCSYNRHKEHQRCPALNETCSFCNKQGHFKAVCRRKKTPDGKKMTSENHVDPSIRKIETNEVQQSFSTRRCPKIKINCQVPGTPVSVQLAATPDTGAEVTLMSTFVHIP